MAPKAYSCQTRKVSRYTLEPSPSALATLREFIRTTLRPYRLSESSVADIVSATHEAAKNAVVHNPESTGPVDVVCEIKDDRVVVEVADRGQGFDLRALSASLPDPEAVAGRGYFLMNALMDGVETQSGKGGTRVRMVKAIARPNPA
ncbi:MAG: ATP-binding protein [Actinomycetota bacterium]